MKKGLNMDSYELVQVDTPEDWACLHRLRREELFTGTNIEYDENHPDDRAVDHFPLILKLDDECIGTARLDMDGEDGTAIMRLVAIQHSKQKQGHGRVLELMFEDLARQHDASIILVNANPTAIGYYRSLGFVEREWADPTGTRAGIAKDCLQMAKDI